MKSFLSFLFDLAKVVLIATAIIAPVRYFLAQPFFVKGASMEPNFLDGEYLVVDEISYRLGEPQRGDVIIFKYPLDPSEFYIKRIIGLPNETVEVIDGKVVIYNEANPGGWVLEEDYLPTDIFTPYEGKQKLGSDEYYVMGDNRSASFDSRRWGVLNRDLIIGKAWIRAWPVNSFSVINTPSY